MKPIVFWQYSLLYHVCLYYKLFLEKRLNCWHSIITDTQQDAATYVKHALYIIHLNLCDLIRCCTEVFWTSFLVSAGVRAVRGYQSQQVTLKPNLSLLFLMKFCITFSDVALFCAQNHVISGRAETYCDYPLLITYPVSLWYFCCVGNSRSLFPAYSPLK
jgi:hypothetical protein